MSVLDFLSLTKRSQNKLHSALIIGNTGDVSLYFVKKKNFEARHGKAFEGLLARYFK